MNILVWIIFGALTGWISSMIMKTNDQQGFLLDMILGIVGAVIGGMIMNFFGEAGVTGFNIYSFAVAILGAIVVLFVARIVRGGTND